ncbi:MAG: FAD-dependent oxidoreductase [SAR202 cluster bacterium]|nr:FAD-dependent oxidoreductase [SAR202 cluster bacterium]
MRVAVVGAGISGLAAAYRLRHHDVHVFEADARAGGHAHTVTVAEDDREVVLDTGFLVYNEQTYPRFVSLLDELGVATQASEMSFSASCRACDVEYATPGVLRLLGRPSNLMRPSHYGMGVDLGRFYREALAIVASGAGDGMTLEQFLEARRFGRGFRRHVIVPLVAAIWSTPAQDVGRFPLRFLLEFMANHGLLAVSGRLPWRTVTGGSQAYLRRLVAALPHGVHASTPVDAVARDAAGAVVALRSGERLQFDHVVLAAHSDQSLRMLADVTDAERESLSAIAYSPSRVVLHTDASVMPSHRRLWSAWNYLTDACIDRFEPVSVSYYLNRLQRFQAARDYFVSVNPTVVIDPAKVIHEMTYAHPQYTAKAPEAQATLRQLGRRGPVHFAGAYMGNGFHEDGVRAGFEAADAIEQAGIVAVNSAPLAEVA